MTVGPNPSGLCMCGCGEKAPIARSTEPHRGRFNGQPMRYVQGHSNRTHFDPSIPQYLVNAETGCWEWQHITNRDGYAKLGSAFAHRVFYERHKGPIPTGLHIDHLCRNTRCVNPDHLEAVTVAENTRRGNSAKLSADDVRAIRAATGRNCDIARRFGISQSYACQLRQGMFWPGLEDAA